MTTEIHRIPGAFTLPADWPRVRLGDLTSGLWAEYVGDDATATNAANLTTGTPLVLPWSSRTGAMGLTATANVVPNLVQTSDRFKGHRYASFSGSSNMSAQTAPLATPYAGPLTVAGYLYWANNSTSQYVFNTSTGTGGYHNLMAASSFNGYLIRSVPASGTPATISVPAASGTNLPVIACFNGADSYLQVGDTMVQGALDPGITTRLLRVGSSSGGTGGFNGRIAHLRIYQRALTLDEASLTADEFTTIYG